MTKQNTQSGTAVRSTFQSLWLLSNNLKRKKEKGRKRGEGGREGRKEGQKEKGKEILKAQAQFSD